MIKQLQETEVSNATQIPPRSKNDILGEYLARSTHANNLILCVLNLRFREQTSRKIWWHAWQRILKSASKFFIEASMIVIGEALHNFFFFKNLILKSVYSDFKSTHAIGRNRLRKAEAVQVNLRSLDTRISNS